MILFGFFLGASVDQDLDGQPNATATGDDTHGVPDDEDGVTFTTPVKVGTMASVSVVASGPGKLDAWVDFNADGSWSQAGDQIFTSKPLATGANVISFAVPATATPGATFARFRFSSAGGLSFTGLALDGEVEDYAVTVVP